MAKSRTKKPQEIEPKPAVLFVRWMIRPDMLAVVETESECAADWHPNWTEDRILDSLRQRDRIGMAAEIGNAVVGHMIYQLEPGKLTLRRLAVAPLHRGNGVGTAMLKKLVAKLSPLQRTAIEVTIHERSLAALAFFRRLEFRAVATVSGCFEDGDGYRMRFELSESPTP